jgi:hypothetical protein
MVRLAQDEEEHQRQAARAAAKEREIELERLLGAEAMHGAGPKQSVPNLRT